MTTWYTKIKEEHTVYDKFIKGLMFMFETEDLKELKSKIVALHSGRSKTAQDKPGPRIFHDWADADGNSIFGVRGVNPIIGDVNVVKGRVFVWCECESGGRQWIEFAKVEGTWDTRESHEEVVLYGGDIINFLKESGL